MFLRAVSSLGCAYPLTGPDQPCRCLCRGSEQITMTRPCLRMIRHLLQIFFTLGLTFTTILLVNQISSCVATESPRTALPGSWGIPLACAAWSDRLLIPVDDPAAT